MCFCDFVKSTGICKRCKYNTIKIVVLVYDRYDCVRYYRLDIGRFTDG